MALDLVPVCHLDAQSLQQCALSAPCTWLSVHTRAEVTCSRSRDPGCLRLKMEGMASKVSAALRRLDGGEVSWEGSRTVGVTGELPSWAALRPTRTAVSWEHA